MVLSSRADVDAVEAESIPPLRARVQVEDGDGNVHRTVYVATLPEAVDVLHAFRTKAERGSKTSQPEIDPIRERPTRAESRYCGRATGTATDRTAGSGNVFTGLGFEEPEAELLKAKLPHGIATLVGRHGWSRAQTADASGADRAKAPAIVRGRLGGFSNERLLRLPIRADHDVRIIVAPSPSNGRPPRSTVPPLPGSPARGRAGRRAAESASIDPMTVG